MVLSKNMTRDGPQRSHWHLMELPTELHIRIRDHLLTDPDSTLKGLRPLRLVCKTFDDIWSPVVVTDIVLFQARGSRPTEDTIFTDLTDLTQLRHIVHGKSNASTLAGYTTLTIQNLRYVDTKSDRWCSDARRVREQGMIAVLNWMKEMLIVTMILFTKLVFYFIVASLMVCPMIWVIFYIPLLLISTFRTRYYMALLPRKLNMPNIRRVRLLLNYDCSDWVICRLTKILLSLQHLTELELGFANTTDLEYLIRRLAQLNKLHKLTLLPTGVMNTLPRLRCIAALISRNENLTHFDWRLPLAPNFSELFCNMPTNKPLKLHYLSLSCGCTNFDALIPHIRSLTSVEFRSKESNMWCISFSRAKIFPPIIKVESLDQELVTFIRGHPGLVSLTTGSGSIMQGARQLERDSLDSSLCKALTHHSETLQYLFFKSNILAFMLQNVENEANFLLSTGNLQELVLETQEILKLYHSPIYGIYNELRILQVAAQLSHSLTVTIRTGDKAIFIRCVAFCRDSESPLIRDLAGRIVYERARA